MDTESSRSSPQFHLPQSRAGAQDSAHVPLPINASPATLHTTAAYTAPTWYMGSMAARSLMQKNSTLTWRATGL